jgi:hypothetical protein
VRRKDVDFATASTSGRRRARRAATTTRATATTRDATRDGIDGRARARAASIERRGERAARTRAADPTFADALGVTAATWEQVEGGLFGASLFPYLGFLYFLAKPEARCPRGTLFGFKFLLAFVFGTIPFAIYAKVEYDEILANVDVLHGVAESLLTMTNVFIVLGFRQGLRDASEGGDGDGRRRRKTSLGDIGAALFCALATSSAIFGATEAFAGTEIAETAAIWDSTWPHVEPANALSLPTWVIHVSSLVEWLIAMGLAWEYAEVTKRPAWKGLTLGMIPCHASGIAACTFHLFYNAPALNSVVAMQALLTVVGNTTCALASYRIAKEGERMLASPPTTTEPETDVNDEVEIIEISIGNESLKGWEDLSAAWAADSDAVLLLKLALVSAVASAGVKYGSLLVDFPFEPNLWVAYSIIFVPTLLNCAKWKQLSDEGAAL